MIDIEIIIQIAVGILVSFLSAMMISFRNKWEEEKKIRQKYSDNVTTALKVILGKQLDDIYSYYSDLGFIPLDKLHQANTIYEIYHALGGNGTGTAEIEKLLQLPNSLEEMNNGK